MAILRMIFIVLMTLVLLKYLDNDKPWNKIKWLFYPLVLQTLIELPFNDIQIYLPARFCMMVVGVLFFLGYLFLFKKATIPFYDMAAYFICLRSCFLFEEYYQAQNYLYHPYDSFFAFIGIIFLILIFVLNTYYPPNHWLFKKQ